MSGLLEVETRALTILSGGPRTYRELELELNDPKIDVLNLVRRMKKKGKAKYINAGPRQVFFASESQRREATIKSMGKNALEAYRIIKGRGSIRSHELFVALGGARPDHMRHSMRNLVSHGYVNYGKARYYGGGDLYYVGRLSEEDVMLKTRLGVREEQLYRALRGSRGPVTTVRLAGKLGITVSNASGVADRLVADGLAYKSLLSGGPDRRHGRAVYYTNPRHEGRAKVMSVGKYGLDIYRNVGSVPRTTASISESSGLNISQTYQVLEVFRDLGWVLERTGQNAYWRRAPGAPRLGG